MADVKRVRAMEAADRSSRAKWRRLKPEEPKLKVIGSRRCWCGDEMWHDWPGKDQYYTTPHPR